VRTSADPCVVGATWPYDHREFAIYLAAGDTLAPNMLNQAIDMASRSSR